MMRGAAPAWWKTQPMIHPPWFAIQKLGPKCYLQCSTTFLSRSWITKSFTKLFRKMQVHSNCQSWKMVMSEADLRKTPMLIAKYKAPKPPNQTSFPAIDLKVLQCKSPLAPRNMEKNFSMKQNFALITSSWKQYSTAAALQHYNLYNTIERNTIITNGGRFSYPTEYSGL